MMCVVLVAFDKTEIRLARLVATLMPNFIGRFSCVPVFR